MKRSQRSAVVMPSELINVEHPFYSSPSVHLGMLEDKVRTTAFERALQKIIQGGEKILDIGTGTGILALFAARIGASKVYATEAVTSTFHLAKKNIIRNHLTEKIRVIQFRGKRLKIPGKVDIIVSECLGHFGFDENMVKVVAESKGFLRKRGVFIPRNISLYVAAAYAPRIYERFVTPWEKKHYAFDFFPMRKNAVERIYIATFRHDELLSKPMQIIDYKVGDPASNLKGTVALEVLRDGVIHGLVGWFEAQLADDVILSTSPFSASTHWEQSFLPFHDPITVKAKDILFLNLGIRSVGKGNKVEFTWDVSSQQGVNCHMSIIV